MSGKCVFEAWQEMSIGIANVRPHTLIDVKEFFDALTELIDGEPVELMDWSFLVLHELAETPEEGRPEPHEMDADVFAALVGRAREKTGHVI